MPKYRFTGEYETVFTGISHKGQTLVCQPGDVVTLTSVPVTPLLVPVGEAPDPLVLADTAGVTALDGSPAAEDDPNKRFTLPADSSVTVGIPPDNESSKRKPRKP